jgi:hypothetical protein
MTEKELQRLGFERESLEDDCYYYDYDIVDGLSLISSEVDPSRKEEDMFVDIFNTNPEIRFYKMEKVQALINTLVNAKLK